MDCEAFQSRLDEFADGVPGVADDPVRVTHAERCASCRRLVTDITSVRDALRCSLGTDTAPQHLRRLVRSVLAAESERLVSAEPTDRRSTSMPGAPVTVRSYLRRNRLVLIPAAAAVAVVLTLAGWYMLSPTPTGPPTFVYVKNPVLQAVQKRHRWCSREEHVFHRDGDLPDDLPGIAATLSKELGLRVLAPDLRSQGFSFVGARRCKVAGVPVAHMLYFAPRDAVTLSLFSMYKVHGLEASEAHHRGHQYFLLSESPDTTLAWFEGRQTYVLCASLSRNALLPIAESLRSGTGVAEKTRLSPVGGSDSPSIEWEYAQRLAGYVLGYRGLGANNKCVGTWQRRLNG